MSAVEQLAALLKDQPENPLRPHQVEAYTDELERQEKIVNAPPYVTGVSRGDANTRARQLKSMLHTQAPKRIEEPLRRDQVARLANEVLEHVIRPTLQTQATMRRNPAGAVGAFNKGENSRPVKKAIGTWKRAMRALDPSNDDPDYTNVERFRASGMVPGTSTFMADAQIPGVFAMTPQAKENWPLPPPTNTALGQVQKRERKQMSPETRQRLLDNLARARANSAAKKQAARLTPPTEAQEA